MKIKYNDLQHLNDVALLLPGTIISSMYWSRKAHDALADVNFKLPQLSQFTNKQDYVQWHLEQAHAVVAEAMKYQLGFIILMLRKIIK